MLQFAKPEEMGISSANIQAYLKVLEEAGLSSHAMIIMRHGKVIFEKYWAPFHVDFPHRTYSVTKSFVALAIGFLEQEGKLCLDDKIVDLFPPEITEGAKGRVREQTVRDMLTMRTGFPMTNWDGTPTCKDWWFSHQATSRLKDYFSQDTGGGRIPGTLFQYDSFGSFVLGALVEHISGESLQDFLRVRLFDKIGVSDKAWFLKCPGGNAWGDSGLLCTARDLLKSAWFTMNGGRWNGEQILNDEFLRTATSKLVSTHTVMDSWEGVHGYGYQIWKAPYDGFFFNGMGSQLAIGVPHKDMVFVYFADTQGNPSGKATVFGNFYNYIVNTAPDGPLPENKQAEQELLAYADSLILHVCRGEATSAFAEKINGKTFELAENTMGITKLRLFFEGDEGVLEYTNAQGDKWLPFGFLKNVFGPFPQEGYADEIGGVYSPGNYYHCAASAAWVEPQKLILDVQIIDKYFGRLFANLSFKDENTMCMRMSKAAEDFLGEYQGYAEGQRIK